MILPLIGDIAYSIWFWINSYFFYELSPEWLMMEVFQYWPGGFPCMFMGLYSFMSDKSSESSRTLNIAVIDFTYSLASAIAQGRI